MKNSIISVIVLSAAAFLMSPVANAQNWSLTSSSASPTVHDRNEGLKAGQAYVCTVVSVRDTAIDASPQAQALGGILGGALGTAVASRSKSESSRSVLMVLGGAAGGAAGVGIANKVASAKANAVYVRCPDAKQLISVVQEDSLTFTKGQEVLVEQIGSKTRVAHL
jgi:outer membrane lipoprotein SlyB